MWINRRYYSTSYCQYVKITLILCYHVFSTQLVLSNDSSSPVDDSSHTLSEKSYSDVHWEYDASRADLWSPKTPLEVWPDFKPIQECDTREFKQFQPSSNKLSSGLNNQFEWTSISVFNSERVKRGHILLGGSFRRQQPDSLEASDTVSPRQNSHVFLCHLDMKSDRDSLLGFGFNENPCTLLEQTSTSSVNDHEFLGASSEALKINQDISLFVYCDPLWRAGSKVPVGRCFSHIVRNGQVQPSLELADFCQTGMQVATPCAAGQSVALSMGNDNSVKTSKSVANLLSNVRLWVGEPLSTPHGRIQILTDLYGSMKLITIPRPENTESMAIGSFFGYALTEDFVTAPGLLNSRQDGNYTNPIHLVGIHLAKSSRESTNGFYGTVDWFPETSRSDQFSGNGMSVLRVHLKGPYIKSVVMGAPYAGDTDKSENQSDTSTTQSVTYNRGRIYLFCQSDHGISLKSDMHQVSTAYDYLDGPKGSTNFGFALTNLGDFDGDGNDELAVGAPDLKNAYGYSYIYIIRTLSNCRFDRTPLHRLTSPPGAYDFGAHLPSRAYDLDFNGLNDLVVPISPSKGGEFSQTAIVFASRHTWTAECQFTFPPWLAIRNLLANDIIPVQIMIYFKGGKNKLSRLNQSDGSIFFQSSDLLKFIHQINTDWNSSQLAGQRFSLAGPIKSHLEVKQNQLIVEFNIQAKMNVEDMHDLESDKKTGSGVYLGYRFLQPCYGDQNVIDRNGSCPNGGWLKRPIIDWSKCIAKIPLSRYVCYPRPECESDVGIRVKDVQSGQIVAWGDMVGDKEKSAADHNGIITNNNNNVNNNITRNITDDFIPSTTIDIEYGNTNMSRPQLQIEIYNYGPTKAQGTRMELQFHGNLRFSRLEFDVDTSEAGASNSISQSEPLMVEVSENETWVHCPIGTLLAPVVMSDTGSEIIEPSQRFILSTYYDQFMSEDDTNFQNGAGVTINVITGTPDPQPISNTIRFNYRVIHKPRIRISYGPGEISSRMDNRSAPSKRVPGQQQRVLVSDIGPKIEHTLQIEYMGPSNRLKNVTITAAVPIELNPEDAIGGTTPPYIVYMFNEIRGTQSHENNALKWIDVRPKLLALGRQNADDTVSKVGTCTIVSSESVINPRGVIPMDVDTLYSRKRRGASNNPVGEGVDEMNEDKYSTDSDNQSVLYDENVQSSLSSKIPVIQFRRLQKEVFQCNRVGNRIQKPICAEIVCHIDELLKHRPVVLKVTGWLWARTLFAKHISDVDLVTTISVNQGEIPEGVHPAEEPVGHFYLSQTFFFPQIRPKLIHQIPIWPIIVGVVLGLIVLYLLIILLYLLGFFRRRKTQLRKAMLTKGGAEETYKREQTESLLVGETKPEQTNDVAHKAMNSTPPGQGDAKMSPGKKLKKKHKKDLNILHPGDLSTVTTSSTNGHQHHAYKESEEQNLITDSTSSQ